MIFEEYDTVDPMGVPVQLVDRKKLDIHKQHGRLRVEDRTANYVRYRQDKTGIKLGHWLNEGE